MTSTPSAKSRSANVFQHGHLTGHLTEHNGGAWHFTYLPTYEGEPVSLTLPIRRDAYLFDTFPPVFEGLLPEGPQLEALLRKHKIDRGNAFAQLIIVGGDLVGSLTVTDTTR